MFPWESYNGGTTRVRQKEKERTSKPRIQHIQRPPLGKKHGTHRDRGAQNDRKDDGGRMSLEEWLGAQPCRNSLHASQGAIHTYIQRTDFLFYTNDVARCES